MNTKTVVQFSKVPRNYRQANVHFEDKPGAALFYMRPEPRPCFTAELLQDISDFQDEVVSKVDQNQGQREGFSLQFTVLASDLPGIYSFGGDLNLFAQLIRKRDREALRNYALNCVRSAHRFSVGFDLPLTSIALVQGQAQGGGFEAALSCNVLIAERGTQMGFPEVLFNLFPGMGAYSFLSRKVAPSIAERLILSGKLYSAEELYERGVVDVLAEPGKGKEALQTYITEAKRYSHVRRLFRRVRTTHNRVPYEELQDITELWVDSALRLTEREIKTMERLVRAQDKKVNGSERQAL